MANFFPEPTRDWLTRLEGQISALPGTIARSRSTAAPPGSPATGDTYLVPSGATGTWAPYVGTIAKWSGTAWAYSAPVSGTTLWVVDEALALSFDGSAWRRTIVDTDSRLYQTIPVDQCTVGGAALTDANVVAALNTAYAAAVTRGCARIHLPRKAGGWNVGMTDKLDWYGQGPFKNVYLDCEPGTAITLPVGYSGDFLRLRGSTPAPSYWHGGGVRNLVLGWASQDPSNTGRALVLDSVVSSTFEDVLVYNGQAGSGIAVDYSNVAPSLYCTFLRCLAAGNGYNWNLKGLANSQIIGAQSQGAFVSDFKIDNCETLLLLGGAVQSTNPSGPIFDLSGDGGSWLYVCDFYNEGTAAGKTLFYCPDPTVTHNGLVVKRFVYGSSFDKLFDVTGQWNLHVEDVRAGGATTFLKARSLASGRSIHIINSASYKQSPSLFDMDAQSKTQTRIDHFGDALIGGVLQSGTAIELARYNLGAEPVGPAGGAILYSPDKTPVGANGAGAGRVLCEDGVWRTIAFDPDTWYSILWPFAGTGELWWADNNAAVSAWGGMVHGYSFAQATGGNQPTIVAASTFSGKNVLRFTRSSAQVMLTGDVGSDIVKATDLYPYAAMLVAFRNYSPDPGYQQSPILGWNSDQSLAPLQVQLQSAVVNGITTRAGTFVPGASVAIANNTAVLLEWWTDAAGQHFALNYNAGTHDALGSWPNDTAWRQLGIGGNDTSGTYNADLDIRGLAVLPSKPADSVRLALHRFCQADSGI